MSTSVRINCNSGPFALKFLRMAQSFSGAYYTASKKATADAQSCSGLIAVTLRALARQGIEPVRIRDLEKFANKDKETKLEYIKKNNPGKTPKITTSSPLGGLTTIHEVDGKKVEEPYPCTFLWNTGSPSRSVAVPLMQGYHIVNRPDLLFGCFWLSKIGKLIDKVEDLRTGDLVFFNPVWGFSDHCPINDADKGYYWSQMNGGCFRGVKGLPIDHMGIVQGFDPKKGMLFTFEQSYVVRQNQFCQNLGSGAKPRIWCLPDKNYEKERDFIDRNSCKENPKGKGEDNDLGRFAGGIRLQWHRDQNAFDVWAPEEFKPESTRIVPIVECVRETRKACPSLGRVPYVSETSDPRELKRFKKSTWAKADPDCIFKKASHLSKVSLTLLQSVMAQESAGRQFATSTYDDPDAPGGIDHARGYTQVIASTAAGMGIGMKQIFDPYYNICGGVHYFTRQLHSYKVVECALAAYNGGLGSIQHIEGIQKIRKKKDLNSEDLKKLAKECKENARYAQTRHYVQVIADDWHRRI